MTALRKIKTRFSAAVRLCARAIRDDTCETKSFFRWRVDEVDGIETIELKSGIWTDNETWVMFMLMTLWRDVSADLFSVVGRVRPCSARFFSPDHLRWGQCDQ
jgi:hypothetical protein